MLFRSRWPMLKSQQPVKHLSSKGSSPLELVATVALLLLPVTPITMLAGQLQDELAAESIARNALRLSILRSPSDPEDYLGKTITDLAASWHEVIGGYEVWCSDGCELISLQVKIGNATAIHTMGVEP